MDKINKLLTIIPPEIITYKVIPDLYVENRTGIISRAWHEMFSAPRDRITLSLGGVQYREKDRACFDIIFRPGQVNFYVSVPDAWAKFTKLKMGTVWPRAAISRAGAEELGQIDSVRAAVCDVRLRKANIFAIKADPRDLDPLNSMMAVLHDIRDNDLVRVSYVFDPIDRVDWSNAAQQDMKKFQKGEMPRRITVTREDLWQNAWKAVTAVLGFYIELRLLIFESIFFFVTREENEVDWYRKIFEARAEVEREVAEKRLEGLAPATTRKITAPAFNTFIRIVSQSDDSRRRGINLRTAANAFKDLHSDNELQMVELPPRVQLRRLKEVAGFKASFRVDQDVFSDEEVAKLIMLPQATLQQEYPAIQNISTRETEVGEILTSGGIHLGEVRIRERRLPVYQPAGNYDELCLGRVGIGGMGSGKTTLAANFAIEAVSNGFGALAIDPAKGEIGDMIEAGLPRDKVQRIRLGERPIALDWCEVKYSPRARARLANTMISFFDSAEETGAQTARYIRAAVMAMQTGRLSEVLRILEDPIYRVAVILQMPEGLNRTTLEQFTLESEGRQRQILAPIYNRMDLILGDPYLAECMDSRESIDMVQLLSRRQATIIDVPKSALGPESVDLIVNLLSTKIDLAMTLRPEKEQFPFFVIFDEPHQYLKSVRTWRSAAVESRKWRVGYFWLFHSWEQLPRGLAEIIKAAGPHYHIYRSSKYTYRELIEEISPFTVEDGLQTPRFTAINVIQAGGITQRPFMAKMAPPPGVTKNEVTAYNTMSM